MHLEGAKLVESPKLADFETVDGDSFVGAELSPPRRLELNLKISPLRLLASALPCSLVQTTPKIHMLRVFKLSSGNAA